MPLDVAIETPSLRRAILAEALRSEMPKGFIWYFPEIAELIFNEHNQPCGTRGCAIGLAQTIWPEIQVNSYLLDDFFGLKSGGARRVFWGGGFIDRVNDAGTYNTFTPEAHVVADALEAEAAE